MIRVEVEPYCNDCLIFEPDVEEPKRAYAGDDVVCQTDTIIRCSHRGLCKRLVRFFERRAKNEDQEEN